MTSDQTISKFWVYVSRSYIHEPYELLYGDMPVSSRIGSFDSLKDAKIAAANYLVGKDSRWEEYLCLILEVANNDIVSETLGKREVKRITIKWQSPQEPSPDAN